MLKNGPTMIDQHTANLVRRLRVNAGHYERRNNALGLSDLLRDAADTLEAWVERAQQTLHSVEIVLNEDEVPQPVKPKPQPRRRKNVDIYIVERKPVPPANEFERDLKKLLDLVREVHRHGNTND